MRKLRHEAPAVAFAFLRVPSCSFVDHFAFVFRFLPAFALLFSGCAAPSSKVVANARDVQITIVSQAAAHLAQQQSNEETRLVLFDGSDCLVRVTADWHASIRFLSCPEVFVEPRSYSSIRLRRHALKPGWDGQLSGMFFALSFIGELPQAVADQMKTEHPPDAARHVAQHLLAGDYRLRGWLANGDPTLVTFRLTPEGIASLTDAYNSLHPATAPSATNASDETAGH